MTTTCIGDTHEHPLFQTHRLCSRSRNERLGFWRPRLSLRAAVSPEHASDRLHQGSRCASVAELVWLLSREEAIDASAMFSEVPRDFARSPFTAARKANYAPPRYSSLKSNSSSTNRSQSTKTPARRKGVTKIMIMALLMCGGAGAIAAETPIEVANSRADARTPEAVKAADAAWLDAEIN